MSIGYYDENIAFTSDWHLNHGNILKYCRRLEFMTSRERDMFHHLESIGDTRMKTLRISQESVNRMNDAIIDGINEVVDEHWVLWVLGDIYFGRSLPELAALRNRIKCKTINIVWGNHDKFLQKLHAPYAEIGHNTRMPRLFNDMLDIIEKLSRGKYDRNDAAYVVRQMQLRNPLAGIFDGIYDQLMFSVCGQEIFANHYAKAVWNKSHRGAWSLYGHSHSNFEPWRENHLPNARTIDVGIDYRAKLGLGYTPWTFRELRSWMNQKEGQAVDHHVDD